LESSSVCVVDATGHIAREAKIASEPEALIAWFKGLGIELPRIGLEAGPLSQWLHAGMKEAGLAVELLETRHVHNAFRGQSVGCYLNTAKRERLQTLLSSTWGMSTTERNVQQLRIRLMS
jgi:transposase